jgi:hypothetical protein
VCVPGQFEPLSARAGGGVGEERREARGGEAKGEVGRAPRCRECCSLSLAATRAARAAVARLARCGRVRCECFGNGPAGGEGQGGMCVVVRGALAPVCLLVQAAPAADEERLKRRRAWHASLACGRSHGRRAAARLAVHASQATPPGRGLSDGHPAPRQ